MIIYVIFYRYLGCLLKVKAPLCFNIELFFNEIPQQISLKINTLSPNTATTKSQIIFTTSTYNA
jgi:hypothetical protein